MSSCTFITCYEGQTQKLFPKHFNTICIRHFLHGTLILQLVCILGSQLIVSCNLYESEFLHARTHVRAQNRTRLKCDTSSVAPDVLPVNYSLLTITLASSVRTRHYHDTKYRVSLMTLKPSSKVIVQLVLCDALFLLCKDFMFVRQSDLILWRFPPPHCIQKMFCDKLR